LIDDSPSPEKQATTLQLQQDLKQHLEKLPAEQRETFVLFEEADLNLHDIAAVTGVSMETAKSRLRYAVNKLRSALQHHQVNQAFVAPGVTQ